MVLNRIWCNTMKVLIDTNIFTLPIKFHIDIIQEIKRVIPNAELCTLESVIREIKNIKNEKTVKIAMQIIKNAEIKIEKEGGETDLALISYAKKNNAIICTNDKEIRQNSIKKQIPIMYMRKKKIFEVRGLP